MNKKMKNYLNLMRYVHRMTGLSVDLILICPFFRKAMEDAANERALEILLSQKYSKN